MRKGSPQVSPTQVQRAETDMGIRPAVDVVRLLGDPESFFARGDALAESTNLGERGGQPGPRVNREHGRFAEPLANQLTAKRVHHGPVLADRLLVIAGLAVHPA